MWMETMRFKGFRFSWSEYLEWDLICLIRLMLESDLMLQSDQSMVKI